MIGREAHGLYVEMFRDQVRVDTWPEDRPAPAAPGKAETRSVTMIKRRIDVGAIATTLAAIGVSEPRETLGLILACFRAERSGEAEPFPVVDEPPKDSWLALRDTEERSAWAQLPDWIEAQYQELGALE